MNQGIENEAALGGVRAKENVVATLAAAVGTGFYEARQASVARTEVSSIREKQEQLVTQVDRLARERDNATSQLVALRAASSELDRNTTELLRLRAEVTRLKTDAQALAQLQAGSTNDQTLSEAVIWRKRVDQLKQRLEQSPGARIPELQFVTEQDWLSAAKAKLETEADYHRALSAIRDAGENKVASMLQEALAAYMKASNEQFPTDLIQLQSYFKSPLRVDSN